jgi:uncharacterized protein
MKSKFARAALLGVGLALFAGPMVLRADSGPAPSPRLITVSGVGEANAVPDSAQLSAGVVTQGKTAAAALAANSRAMNDVFAALRKFGIPEKSIQTSNFNVSPQYTPYQQNATEPPRIVGYQVSNNVSVKVDDLGKLGPALDALVSSGANQVGGVSFTIRDPKPLLAEARAAAVKDAMDRAQTYAKAAGIELGAVASISEGGGEGPRPVFMAMARADAAPPPPIAAGEQTISANVTMSFEIR